MDFETSQNLETFQDGLDRYGSDLAAWPETMRAAAASLVERSPEARAARSEMSEIEALLRSERTVRVGFDLIASRAMNHRQHRPMSGALRRAGWATAVAAALVLGLFVGGFGPDHEEGPDHVMAAALDQAGSSDVD